MIGMNRFVLLKHDTPLDHPKRSHWDLMLESGDHLRTWTLWEFPIVDQPNIAVRDFDHRLHYLDYEGPVSNDRGTVRQVDRGTYRDFQQTESEVRFTLAGVKLNGNLRLVVQISNLNGNSSDDFS